MESDLSVLVLLVLSAETFNAMKPQSGTAKQIKNKPTYREGEKNKYKKGKINDTGFSSSNY